MAADQAGCLRQHRQRPDAQQIDLGQPNRFDFAVVKLGDRKAFGCPLDRHDIRQRTGGHDQATGVNTQVMGLTDQFKGRGDDTAQVGFGHCFQQYFKRTAHLSPWIRMPLIGQQLDQRFGFLFTHPISLRRFANRRAWTHGAHCGYQRHAVCAIGLPHIVKHLIAAYAAKVEIDVGRAGAIRVEKAFKEQVVDNRIDRGNPNTIGDQRVGDTAARADRNRLFAGIAHNIGNQQKERRIPRRVDDL